MTRTDRELSKVVSHALRHEPRSYGLELDDEGWVAVTDLLAGLRRRGRRWSGIDEESLERMLASATKRRFEMVDGRIRALYGHSVPGGVAKSPAEPPARLFHGTAPDLVPVIEEEGLRPMARQFVHLSADRATAVTVGRRSGADPVVLVVDAVAAAAWGVAFFEGNDEIWLAEHVPPRFLTRED